MRILKMISRRRHYMVHIARSATVALLNLPAQHLTWMNGASSPTWSRLARLVKSVLALVNRGYIDNPEANRECKLYTDHDVVWHRTGDLGYWTDDGKLCLVGRLKDVVRRNGDLLQPYPLEAQLETLPGVARAAFVASEKYPDGVIIVEPDENADCEKIRATIRRSQAVQKIGDIQVFFTNNMPVDGRHNTKIDRPQCRSRLNRSQFNASS